MLSPFSGSPSTPKFSHEDTVFYIKKQVENAERNYGMLSKALESYSKNQLHVQSKSVKLGAILDIISEELPESTKASLNKISKLIQQKEQVRGEHIQRVEAFCVEPLTAYPILCSKLMNDMKAQKNAILLQKKKRQQAEQILLKESGEFGRTTSSKISKSQMELAEATGHVSSSTDTLQEAIYKFEDQKTEDLKKILEEYVYSELNFHAKALEILTEAAQSLE